MEKSTALATDLQREVDRLRHLMVLVYPYVERQPNNAWIVELLEREVIPAPSVEPRSSPRRI